MKLLFTLLSLFIITFGCSSGEPGEDGNDGKDNESPSNEKRLITGLCQKGPCFKDGSILVYAIESETMYTTGAPTPSFTLDYFGRFLVALGIAEEYIEVFFNGTCHNEITGGAGIQNLDGIVNKNDLLKNINPLTKIRSIVARDLFGQGFVDIGASLSEAEILVLRYLQMPTLDKKFTEMNLESAGIHDAVLALTNSMILYGRSEAEQGDYIISIAQGVKNDDLTLKAEIAATFEALPLIQIIDNLKSRYASLGLDIEVPKIYKLGAPDYYADILERDPITQIEHNLDASGSCSFDQSTYNTYAIPIVFPEMLDSKYLVAGFPQDSQLSIWTKGISLVNGLPIPETKLQDITALKEIMLKPVMQYNGMFDPDNMPTAGVEYMLVIRKDTDFVLSKICTGQALPFGQVLASDDEMITYTGINTSAFHSRDIKYLTKN